MNMIAARVGLDAMLGEIRIAARAPLAERPGAVAAAVAPYLGDHGLLDGRDCPSNPDRYVRHLLEEGEGYAVVALVWRPGQMSPVHSHHTWCALGVHRGCLTEHFFTPGAPPRLKSALLREEGAVSHGPGEPDLIHRIANCCAETAVSIHVYGVPYAQFADGVNRILA